MSREQEVLDQMRVIIDPDLGKDIVTLGFIKDLSITEDGKVSFNVELTTPACPVKEQFRSACDKAVRRLPWVTDVSVTMTAQKGKGRGPMQANAPGLAKVGPIIAVSSCKGGVGKSTVAVNFAYALQRAGARVGIFDADVYGPSLPTLVRPRNTDLYQANELIVPLEHEGVKLMSFGYVPRAPGKDAAIMRGPMVSGVINQLLTGTDWGELDYLVLDLPPGTGDIQLTLAQLIPLTAAIIVTTPQQLSFVDVVKGIQMFDQLKIPTVAVVENMSYFTCGNCNERHALFGAGARDRLVQQYGFKNTFEIPLVPDISAACDEGQPVALDLERFPFAQVYHDLAAAVVREVSRIRHGAAKRPTLGFDADRGMVLTMPEGDEFVLPPVALRAVCRCARCVEEMTGQPLLDPNTLDPNLYPVGIQPVGNYAVAVQWSDGHTSSIYPYEAIVERFTTPACAAS